MPKLSREHRKVAKAFRDAGFDVEIEFSKKHVMFLLGGAVVHLSSQGTKQNPRAHADLRRKIRRLQDGDMSFCDTKFTRD